jgi:hypothetical protein
MLCPNCNTERDRKDFQRYATLSQTRAWLKNPNAKTRLHYTGKICNACHKQTVRKPSEIPPEELRKRLVNEGKNPAMVEHIHAQRIKAGKKRQSTGGLRAIKKQRSPMFTPVLNEITVTLAQVRTKRRYIKQVEHNERDLALVMKYLDVCEAQLIIVRDKVNDKRKVGSVPPANWQALIDEDWHIERNQARAPILGRYKDRLARIEAALSGVRESSSQ